MWTLVKILATVFVLIISLSGCNICGGEFTTGDCDGEVTTEAGSTEPTPIPPLPPVPPSPGITLSSLSSSLREIKNSSVGDNDTYTIKIKYSANF